jgi:hypothetical protein
LKFGFGGLQLNSGFVDSKFPVVGFLDFNAGASETKLLALERNGRRFFLFAP